MKEHLSFSSSRLFSSSNQSSVITYNFIESWVETGDPTPTPTAVSVDPSGNVYVIDFGLGIQKFDSDGKFITKWGSSGSEGNTFGFNNGISIDSSSNVYVTDSGNDRIEKFDSDGKFITKWGSSGKGDGQFSSPIGITVDSTGNVYVTDYDDNRIQKFARNK
jgi:sugar lactone lactonase YvrE